MLILGIAWGVFVLAAVAAATMVALFQTDGQHRKDALAVLRTLLSAGTAAGGAGALLIKLHEAGLL